MYFTNKSVYVTTICSPLPTELDFTKAFIDAIDIYSKHNT